MIEILAALSGSAAAGMRIALPLLVIGLLQSDWAQVPILAYVSPPVVLGILTSWSVVEIFASKKLMGQRVMQLVELLLSPLVGGIIAIAVANTTDIPTWIIALIGGSVAFFLQLVSVGWFFRVRGLPLWVVFVQDVLSVVLVFCALYVAQLGGLIALILLLLALRSSNQWRRWYLQNRRQRTSQKD